MARLGPAGLQTARIAPLALLAVGAVAVGVFGRTVPVWHRALWLVGGYLVAVPNLFPWYALWIVPLLAVAPTWPWLYLTSAVALAYLVFAEPVWRVPAWVTAVEFGPVALGLAWAVWPRPTGSAAVARRGAGPEGNAVPEAGPPGRDDPMEASS